jgi:TfoX-like protein
MPPDADSQAAYDHIVQELVAEGAEAGKMFGMPCLKIGSKAFAGYYEGDMTFKLSGEAHQRALALSGAKLFDPSKRGRPMKEWVQVPGDAATEWPELAFAALQYVEGG